MNTGMDKVSEAALLGQLSVFPLTAGKHVLIYSTAS